MPSTRHASAAAAGAIVGFVGAGNMARGLAGGLLANGWDRGRLILSDPDATRRHGVESVLGLKTYADNREVAARADILVLAVKPQVLAGVAAGLADIVQTKHPLVISIAAGVRSGDLDRWLGGGVALVRVMPNTAALVGAGASGLYATARADAAKRAQAESILRAVGITTWVVDESALDVVTALSGTGPAYFFLVMEALEQAAVEAGLERGQARLLTLQTAYGAAKMALESGEEPSRLRARVTSPGGTTERALAVLEEAGLRQAFHRAVEAAVARARELAHRLGDNA